MEKITVDQFVRLYHPVGEIVVQWAITDITLNHIGLYLLGILNRPDLAATWPREFTRRLKLVEGHIGRELQFRHLSASLKPVFKDIRHLVKLRDMLIHGVAEQYDAQKDAVLFLRIDRTKERQRKRKPELTHQRNRMLVRFTMLESAAKGILTVNKALIATREILRAIPRALPKKTH